MPHAPLPCFPGAGSGSHHPTSPMLLLSARMHLLVAIFLASTNNSSPSPHKQAANPVLLQFTRSNLCQGRGWAVAEETSWSIRNVASWQPEAGEDAEDGAGRRWRKDLGYLGLVRPILLPPPIPARCCQSFCAEQHLPVWFDAFQYPTLCSSFSRLWAGDAPPGTCLL